MKPSSLQGLRTVIYYVAELARARDWYAKLLGVEPYFDTPYYVGFNVGGFELGLHPAEGKPTGKGGVEAYWGVDDIAAAWARFKSLGATAVSEPNDVGEGIKVAMLEDPFGNHLGIIENPHFPNTA